MTEMLAPSRLEGMRRVIDASHTDLQRACRLETAQKVEWAILQARDDADLYGRLYNDVAAWAAAFIDDDSGKPLFLSPWQIDFIRTIQSHKYVWTLCSRKIGKSTVLSVLMAWMLCGPDKERIAGFSPTHSQSFVFDKARAMLKASPYLFQNFIANENSEVITARSGTEFINRSISQNTGGETARGEYGSVLFVDEVQSIDQRIMDQVVFPIIADAFSDKKMILIGTPSLFVNPDLENRWNKHKDRAASDPEYACFTVDCWRGIEEGCLSAKFVADRQEDMTPDEFGMEFEARFPETASRFFSRTKIAELVRAGDFHPRPRAGFDYVMAVDWAKYGDRTQILVGEVDPQKHTLTYCEWVEMDPKAQVIDYEAQAEAAKELFWRYGCRWICPDASGTQAAVIEWLLKDGEFPRIPEHYFHGYDPDPEVKVQKLGYLASTSSNQEMWLNHRQQMTRQRLRIPTGPQVQVSKEKRFFRQYDKEHVELEAKRTENGAVKLVEPKGGYKDLAVCAGYLSLYLMQFDEEPASFEIYSF